MRPSLRFDERMLRLCPGKRRGIPSSVVQE